jgi:hypothetical protein
VQLHKSMETAITVVEQIFSWVERLVGFNKIAIWIRCANP